MELLRARSTKTRKRKRIENAEDKDNKASQYCTSNLVHKYERTTAAQGFSENHAISEMRSCLARHDWAGLRELFPLLLGCYSDLEPIVWRYALAILLCTPESDSSHLQDFLEMCLGARTTKDSHLLEQLLTLQ